MTVLEEETEVLVEGVNELSALIKRISNIKKPPYDIRLYIDEATYNTQCDFWPQFTMYVKPKNFLELGTGQGRTAGLVLTQLSGQSVITTINKFDRTYRFGHELDSWKSDKRLKMIVGETCDPNVMRQVPDGVDVMFIDSDHRAFVAINELCLYERKLADNALVIVDDLLHNDMMKFWDNLPYEKLIFGGQGIFRYDSTNRYSSIPHPV